MAFWHHQTLLEPWHTDALWLALAFLSGIASRRVNLPPLIGFLFTGFLLGITGLTSGHISEVINTLSDLGVILLLFTIGLKIKVNTLIRPEIWVTASWHMLLSVLTFSAVLFALSYFAAHVFGQMTLVSSLMIGFALSFSSTVFVVKVLEERGELNSQHGKIAIGILVIQDIFAVLFLSVSASSIPGWTVLLLPAILFVVRIILNQLLNKAGHGELLTIFGFFATFIGGALTFAAVGLKPDLGALVAGMLLVPHPRSDELYDRMMSFKDFFLVAFFMSIGLSGQITLNAVLIALAFLLLIPFKSALFLVIFRRMNIRARTAFLTALSMSNYSEFGLIVGVVAVKSGLMPTEWLVAIALMMSGSFLISAPLNRHAHAIFNRFKSALLRLNREDLVVDSRLVDFRDTRYVVIGLGTLGLPAFRHLSRTHGTAVLGLDFNTDRVKALADSGERVQSADATDPLLWDNASADELEVVFLAMSDYEANLNAIREIMRMPHRKFKIGALVHYDDQRTELEQMGVEYVYCYKDRLGKEFAESYFEQ
ncbi:MAG: cation:proton antiporter [Flavobacteriales bacterium]|jgi:predicted Kef-type K+ transport protein